MICPKCGRGELKRVERKGFFQEQVGPLLGRFPWRCPVCRGVSMMKERGKARRRSSDSDSDGEA